MIGLYNDALETQSPLNEDTISSISLFLARLPQPICLIAHNGNGYDFKILNAELKRIMSALPGEIYSADSLEALRALDSEAADKISDSAGNINNGTNTGTPIGQNIPEVPEQVIDVKGRVRQIKRKCEADFDRVPIQAKSVRKRLFDSAGKGDEVKNEDPLDLTGRKSVGSSLKMSADVVSKRSTCDVESVKKRLSFDEDDDEDDECDEENKDIDMLDLDENQKKTEDVDGSLPDMDFLQAVEHVENAKGNFTAKSESRASLNCATPVCHTKVSDCVTPKEKTVSVLANCEGLCTPETPSTNSQQTMSTPQKDQCLTPKKGQVLTPQSEQCLTPVTGLVRSTAAFQLNTPVSRSNGDSINNLKKKAVPNGIACRSLFRSAANNSSSRCRPGTSPVSHFPKRFSYKLGDVYKRMFGQDPYNLHSAETDCVTLMKIVKQRSPAFIQWVDEHAVLLSSIEHAY